ncbi:hypothetical protein J009_00971 [Cryptococcus neoformans]|nr:hypothetical protein J009_00971 [Cryptococcus neoformans var. grubii]
MLLFHPSISTLPHATQAPAPKSPTTIKSVAYTANLRWPAWLAQHILRPLLEASTLHKLCECVKPLTSKSLEEAPRDPTC